jgi:membrane protein YqaA with SNARE-associated domain
MQEIINLLLMSVFTFIIGAIVGWIIGGIVKRTRVRKARNELKGVER